MGAPSKVDLKETVGIAKLKEVFKAVKEADGGAGVDKWGEGWELVIGAISAACAPLKRKTKWAPNHMLSRQAQGHGFLMFLMLMAPRPWRRPKTR